MRVHKVEGNRQATKGVEFQRKHSHKKRDPVCAMTVWTNRLEQTVKTQGEPLELKERTYFRTFSHLKLELIERGFWDRE